MCRWIGMLVLAVLLVALSCVQKPTDWTSGRAAPNYVHRDVRQVDKKVSMYPPKAGDESVKKPGKQPGARMPGMVTSADVRRDANQAAKTSAAYAEQTKNENQAVDRASGNGESKIVPYTIRRVVREESEYSKQTKQEFEKKYENQLRELDVKIAKLRAKGVRLEGMAKEDLNRKMAELDVKRDAAFAKLAELVKSSEDDWNEAKTEAEWAYNDLEDKLQNLVREYSD